MKQVFGGSIFLLAGGLAGLVSAVVAVDAFGSSPVGGDGPWQRWATASGSARSYYATAHYLLGGRLPPAPSQMQEMTADHDSNGDALSSACSYTVAGKTGALAWWSLAAATGGSTAPAIAGMLTSDGAVLESDGALAIAISASPQPGNWIRPPERRSFVLMFTAAGENGLGQRTPLPELSITRSSC